MNADHREYVWGPELRDALMAGDVIDFGPRYLVEAGRGPFAIKWEDGAFIVGCVDGSHTAVCASWERAQIEVWLLTPATLGPLP